MVTEWILGPITQHLIPEETTMNDVSTDANWPILIEQQTMKAMVRLRVLNPLHCSLNDFGHVKDTTPSLEVQ